MRRGILLVFLIIALLVFPSFAVGPTIVENICPSGASTSGATDQKPGGPAWLNQTITAAADERVCNITYAEANNPASVATGAPFRINITIRNATGIIASTNNSILWNKTGQYRNASFTTCANLKSGYAYSVIFYANGTEFSLNMSNACSYSGGAFYRYDGNWATFDTYMILWNEVVATPDTTAPSVNISFPTNNTWMNPDTQNLSVYASDNVAVANVTIYGNWTANKWYYQESANITNQSGTDTPNGPQDYTGNYAEILQSGSFVNSSFAYDGNYLTGESVSAGRGQVNVNYTRPYRSSNTSLWQIKGTDGVLYNLSIDASCLDGRILRLQGDIKTTVVQHLYWGCYSFDGSSLAVLRDDATASPVEYEEGMWWNISVPNVTTITSPTNNTNSTFNVTGLSDGAYSWYAIACDTSNNCTATGNYTFFTDSNLPQITNVATTPGGTHIRTGTPIYFNATITETNLASIIFGFSNGTNYTVALHGSGNYSVYFGSILPVQHNYTWWAVDLAGNSVGSSGSILGFTPYLGPCGGISNTTVINISFYDELSFTGIYQTLEYNASLVSGSLSFGQNGSAYGYYVPICIYPTDSQFSLTGVLRYSNSTNGYAYRYYYFDEAAVSNITSNISLYNLNPGVTSNVTVTVNDPNGLAVQGVYAFFLRYNISTNSYSTVAVGLTDSQGKAVIRLQVGPDVYYKIIL